jgi:hypothetical protein
VSLSQGTTSLSAMSLQRRSFKGFVFGCESLIYKVRLSGLRVERLVFLTSRSLVVRAMFWEQIVVTIPQMHFRVIRT